MYVDFEAHHFYTVIIPTAIDAGAGSFVCEGLSQDVPTPISQRARFFSTHFVEALSLTIPRSGESGIDLDLYFQNLKSSRSSARSQDPSRRGQGDVIPKPAGWRTRAIGRADAI